MRRLGREGAQLRLLLTSAYVCTFKPQKNLIYGSELEWRISKLRVQSEFDRMDALKSVRLQRVMVWYRKGNNG